MGSEEVDTLEVGGEGGSLSIWSLGIEGYPERFVSGAMRLLSVNCSMKGTQRACRSLQNRTLRGPSMNPTYARGATLGIASILSMCTPNSLEAVLQEVTTLGGTSQAERWKQILRDIE